jgi:hypothetical protein
MNAFWASVNFDAFMSSTPPSQGKYSEKLESKTIQLSGGRASSSILSYRLVQKKQSGQGVGSIASASECKDV